MGPESRGYVPPEAMRQPEEKEGGIPQVPESEMKFTFVASGGPGGQNSNKVASTAMLRWEVFASQAFSDEQKEKIWGYAGKKYRVEDTKEIIIKAKEHRDQPQNKSAAAERLQKLVSGALETQNERLETRVPRHEKQKRMDDKRHESRKKQERKGGNDGY